MKPIKLKKIKDTENCLGYENIEILDIHLAIVREAYFELDKNEKQKAHFYDYEYVIIADGKLTTMTEDDWAYSFHDYEVVE